MYCSLPDIPTSFLWHLPFAHRLSEGQYRCFVVLDYHLPRGPSPFPSREKATVWLRSRDEREGAI